jgi:glycopeptide antibiotics resistance protein
VIPLNTVEGGSSISNRQVLNVRGDYWLHALAYIPLPILMGITIQDKVKRTGKTLKTIWMKVIFYSIVLAASLEFFQLLLSSRTFNINDLAGNTGGVMVGFLLMLAFNINRNSIYPFYNSKQKVFTKK